MLMGPVRIATFVVLTVSGVLLLVGLASPDWTEDGGGFWTIKHHIPLYLTISRVLVLMGCIGFVVAEVFYIGSLCCADIGRKRSIIIEAILLFVCSGFLTVGLIIFSQYHIDEALGGYGYSFWLACIGNGGIICAVPLSILDLAVMDDSHERLS